MFRKKKAADDLLHCSFCDKSQRDVKKLIAGPRVQICDECVDICVDVLSEDAKDAKPDVMAADEKNPPVGHGWSPPGVVLRCALCRCATPPEHSLSVRNRGVVCAGCIGAVEAAIAERNESPAPEA
jgi:hypothetical protein